MHYLEIIEVAANYLSYLNFDLFSRMSTRKSLDAQHQGFFMRQRESLLSGAKRIKKTRSAVGSLWLMFT